MDAAYINEMYKPTENKGLKTKNGEEKGFLDHIADYGKSASGSFRIFHLSEKISKLASYFFQSIGSALTSVATLLSKQLKIAKSFLSIPRLPGAYQQFKNTILNWNNKSNGKIPTAVDHFSKVGDLAESGSVLGFAIGAATGSVNAINVANTLDLASNLGSLPKECDEFGKIIKLHQFSLVNRGHILEGVFQRIEDSKTHRWMRLIKLIISIATGALALSVLAFGGPSVPAVALLSVGIFNSILAIAVHFYRETRKYSLIELS